MGRQATISDSLRAGLEFCSDLATIPDLKEITAGELLVIHERYSRVYRPFFPQGFHVRPPTPEMAREEVKRLHRWLRGVLVPLLDAKAAHRLLSRRMTKEAVEAARVAGAMELPTFLRRAADNESPWF